MLGRFARTALALGALGCAADERPTPTPQVLRDAVADHFSREGITPESIACAQPRGETVDCEATVGGAPLPIVVTVGERGDALIVRTRDPTLVAAKLEPEVQRKLEELGHDVKALACEGVVWRIREGDTGRCSMTDTRGRAWAYEATFTGEDTRHRAAIVPQ